MKIAPRQRRARVTIDAILDATSRLLVEHGVENLSTNMICEKAGLTPPALYRYFPNKYAVLKELAVRFKNVQTDIFSQWVAEGGVLFAQRDGKADRDAIVQGIYAVQMAIYEASRHDPANVWISRIVRTQPTMADLRAEWRERSFGMLRGYLGQHQFNATPEEINVCASITIELIHSTIESVTEGLLDPHQAFTTVANMVASEYIRLASRRD